MGFGVWGFIFQGLPKPAGPASPRASAPSRACGCPPRAPCSRTDRRPPHSPSLCSAPPARRSVCCSPQGGVSGEPHAAGCRWERRSRAGGAAVRADASGACKRGSAGGSGGGVLELSITLELACDDKPVAVHLLEILGFSRGEFHPGQRSPAAATTTRPHQRALLAPAGGGTPPPMPSRAEVAPFLGNVWPRARCFVTFLCP